MNSIARRLSKLEGILPVVQAGRGFFIVGTDSQADAIREQFANAGELEPACIVTGIERDRPLWLPAGEEPAADKALRSLSDAELEAMTDIIRTALGASLLDGATV